MKKFQVLAISLLLLGCSKDADLKKSVFIPDPTWTDLPQYSEWGYNTFGVYFDRKPFISNDLSVPIKILNQQGKTSLLFTGQTSGGAYYQTSNTVSMKLTISNLNVTRYSDLVVLNNTTMDLTDPKYEIVMEDETGIKTAHILNGTFQVKHARVLLVDGVTEEVILSGVFDFQALIDDQPMDFSEGRFDVGVGTSNFFVY